MEKERKTLKNTPPIVRNVCSGAKIPKVPTTFALSFSSFTV